MVELRAGMKISWVANVKVPRDWGGVYAARCPEFHARRALTGMAGPAGLARAARHGSARTRSFMPLNDLWPDQCSIFR